MKEMELSYNLTFSAGRGVPFASTYCLRPDGTAGNPHIPGLLHVGCNAIVHTHVLPCVFLTGSQGGIQCLVSTFPSQETSKFGSHCSMYSNLPLACAPEAPPPEPTEGVFHEQVAFEHSLAQHEVRCHVASELCDFIKCLISG